MRTGRNSGERTCNDGPFLGMEVALHEETHASQPRLQVQRPNRWVGGGAKRLRPPRFAMPTTQVGCPTQRAAPSRTPTAPYAAERPGWARSAPA